MFDLRVTSRYDKVKDLPDVSEDVIKFAKEIDDALVLLIDDFLAIQLKDEQLDETIKKFWTEEERKGAQNENV